MLVENLCLLWPGPAPRPPVGFWNGLPRRSQAQSPSPASSSRAVASFTPFLILLTRTDATAADSQPVGVTGKADAAPHLSGKKIELDKEASELWGDLEAPGVVAGTGGLPTGRERMQGWDGSSEMPADPWDQPCPSFCLPPRLPPVLPSRLGEQLPLCRLLGAQGQSGHYRLQGGQSGEWARTDHQVLAWGAL